MKHRTMKKLLTGFLVAAMLVTALPANLTTAQAAKKTLDATSPLEDFCIIDAAGEEDTSSDLPDRNRTSVAQPYALSNGDLVIAIDPGHGGTDAGATYGGIKEKDINLKIAQYIQTYLQEYPGVQVYLTRSTDTYVGISERVANAVAANADVFISIHNNASTDPDVNGSMVFYPNESYLPDLSYEGAELSQTILGKLTALGLADGGIRIRNSENGSQYADGSISDYYGVIRNAKLSGIPGIIVEHAFVSNASERENYLSTDAQLKKLAQADVKGIAEYYGLVNNTLTKPQLTLRVKSYKELELTWDKQKDAKGYIVYRSDKKDSGYTRLKKIVGGENTSYIDGTVEKKKNYYYKVRAYSTAAGSSYYSEYSDVVSGCTLAGTTMTEVRQMTGGYLKIRWNTLPEAIGYAVYRSTEGGAYERIATVSDPLKGAYNDKTAKPGVTYTYKLLTIHTADKKKVLGKGSNTITATMLKTPDMKRLDIRDDGYIKVVWNKALGATSYVVQRSTSEDEGFQTIATIEDDTKNYYYDKNAERGLTYYYRVKAVHEQDKVSGSTGYGEVMGAQNKLRTPELTKVRISISRPGMYIIWTEVPGADGYRIYRSTSKNGSFKKVATVRGTDVLDYIDESSTTVGTTYYYKVKAFVHNSQGTSWSEASAARGAQAGYSIMGKSSTDPEKMAAFYIDRGGVYPEDIYADYGAETLEEFCEIVYEEAEAEGVKAEVVFGQVCKETGFLGFGGDVEPEQCNFAGIGATGGVPGASFPDVRTGIRAQVQHLKAYASDEPLNQECVDPRFTYVKRLAALYVEWLGVHENPTGAGWATGVNYGYSLRDDYIRPLLGY